MFSVKQLAVPLAVLAWVAHAHAQSLGQVVVTATRDERPVERTLADVTTIDSEQISSAGVSSVTQLLQSLGGVEIAQTGGRGSTAGIFVRGTAKLIGAVGNGLRSLQNGDVQAYVTAVVVGLAAMLVLAEAIG